MIAARSLGRHRHSDWREYCAAKPAERLRHSYQYPASLMALFPALWAKFPAGMSASFPIMIKLSFPALSVLCRIDASSALPAIETSTVRSNGDAVAERAQLHEELSAASA